MHATNLAGFILSAVCLVSGTASAEGWCDIPYGGYELVSHGTLSEALYITAQLPGAPGPIWIRVSDATVGKGNVALILAAQMAEKGIAIYLDAPSASCATFPSWAPIGGVRHVRILQ